MSAKKKFLLFFFTVFVCMLGLSILVLLQDNRMLRNRVGVVAGVFMAIPSPTVTPTQTPIPTFTPKPMPNSITFVDAPQTILQGAHASFTWMVNGPAKTIPATAIYLGKTSSPEPFSVDIPPSATPYTLVTKEFLNGSYDIPLRFIASLPITDPGTYYAKAYARIGAEHYWSGERTFTVTVRPKHEIKVVDPPTAAAKGSNIPFTWEVTGPGSTTGFTTIVFGKLSKPGVLDETIDIAHTPYAVLIKDFTSGSYNVPLRFIGNASILEPGEYYYRAITFVDGKNIWSDEYSLKVE